MKKQKMFTKIAAFFAAVVMVVTSPCMAALAEELPYDTYNYDYRKNIVLTPAAYVPNGRTTGLSAGTTDFKEPQDLCVAPDGLVYVADTGNNRIVVLDESLNKVVRVIDSFKRDGADDTFLEQSFGAVSAVAICASGLMGLPLAVSGLREMKILKRLRVTPVSPVFILGVELSMYIVYCAVSLATLSVAALLWGVRLRGSIWAFLGSWLLTMLSTLSVGMLAGGVAKDTGQASVIASILYFPMLIFSGATLPIEVMPPVIEPRIFSRFSFSTYFATR